MLRCSLLQCTLRIKFQKTLHACPHATHTDQRIPQIVAAGAAFPGLAFPVLSSLRPDAGRCAGTHDEDRAGAPASVRSDAVARAARASAVRGRRIGDSCLSLAGLCELRRSRAASLLGPRRPTRRGDTRGARARAASRRGRLLTLRPDAAAGERGARERGPAPPWRGSNAESVRVQISQTNQTWTAVLGVASVARP